MSSIQKNLPPSAASPTASSQSAPSSSGAPAPTAWFNRLFVRADKADIAKDPSRAARLANDAVPIAERLRSGKLSYIDPAKLPTTWRKDLAARIDATNLDPKATPADIQKLCEEAGHFGMRAVCVMPKYAELAGRLLRGTGVKIACVAGFPAGTGKTELKVAEARAAIKDGATEIDMVAATGFIAEGSEQLRAGKLPRAWVKYRRDVEAVARACAESDTTLKVILQTSLLRQAAVKLLPADASDADKAAAGDAFVKFATHLAAKAIDKSGAPGGFLKTSDGVYCKAEAADAKIFSEVIAAYPHLKLEPKIAGGVDNAEQADAFVKSAGSATVFGTSKFIAIISGKTATGGGY